MFVNIHYTGEIFYLIKIIAAIFIFVELLNVSKRNVVIFNVLQH